MEFPRLDSLDNQILSILEQDGRASYSNIGTQVGLSRVAVKNRVRAMENAGIIQGYRAIVTPANVPGVTAFVLNLETTAEAFEETRQLFSGMPEVVYLTQTTGECHLTGVVAARDITQMRQIVNEASKQVSGIRRITAHTILDHIKGEIISDK